MSKNRGKDFESKVSEAIKSLGICIERLYDVTSGHLGIHTPSDFIAYKYPSMYYLECKSITGNTLRIADIRQFDDLLVRSKYDGVFAGLLIWYIDCKETFWVDIRYINKIKNEGLKSLNRKNLEVENSNYVRLIDATYPRIYGKYDFSNFFSII